jgi:outer membrane murein-binding lipoprotein Lpp
MRSTRLLFAALLASGLLVAGGCGGGDDDDGGGDSGGSALTKEEFTAKANEICTEGQDKIAQVQKDVQAKIQEDPTQAANAIQEVVGQLVPVIRETLTQIGQLTPPAELQAKLDEFTTKANDAVDQLESDPSKVTQGDNPFSDLEPLATELGIQNCGQTTGG